MFDTLTSGELVEAIAASQRDESILMANRMAVVAELLGRRIVEVEDEDPDPGYMTVTGFHRTTAEVAAALNLSPMAASYVVSHAETLDERLPKVAAVLASGDTGWRTVQLIITRTELVHHEAMPLVDANLADRIAKWASWSRRRITDAVDAAVRVHDPAAVRERQLSEDRRRVNVTPLGDGTAKLDGLLAADAAVAFDRRVAELAGAVCSDDPRTLDQRRTDALTAMAEGRTLACRCGAAECPNQGAELAAGGTRVVINVVASERSVVGESNQPGYIEGYGVIDAEQLRELAARASLRLLEEPTVSAAEALRYQPSAALERYVRMRDLTCRFPGCDRQAAICDLDHTIPFDHDDPESAGLTVGSNLKCLCRQHHRLKTFHEGWHDEQLGDGTVVWTSPAGKEYRTVPGGTELFPELRQACAAPKPLRRNRSREREARRERTRNRIERMRPANKSAKRLAQARRREIKDRIFRNDMRRMLFLFKGAPSTSPFCAWVNDPMEPEELPPDWQPPPEPPPPPEDPPF